MISNVCCWFCTVIIQSEHNATSAVQFWKENGRVKTFKFTKSPVKQKLLLVQLRHISHYDFTKFKGKQLENEKCTCISDINQMNILIFNEIRNILNKVSKSSPPILLEMNTRGCKLKPSKLHNLQPDLFIFNAAEFNNEIQIWTDVEVTRFRNQDQPQMNFLLLGKASEMCSCISHLFSIR